MCRVGHYTLLTHSLISPCTTCAITDEQIVLLSSYLHPRSTRNCTAQSSRSCGQLILLAIATSARWI